MDPASLAIGIAGVVETARQLVEYLHDVKDGGKQRIRLTAEISALWLVLENVKVQVEDLSSPASLVSLTHLTSIGGKGGPLEHCADVLQQLLEKCKPRHGAHGVLQNLRWAFDKDEVQRYLEVVHRLQSTINLAYAQTALSILNTVASDVDTSRQVLEDRELNEMLEWLSPVDFEAQQRQAFSKWCLGTLLWFLGCRQFNSWKEGVNRYLWCPGSPGSGKSTLSSLAIHTLRTSQRNASTPSAVLGVYFAARSTESGENFVSEVLRNLLKQLCSLPSMTDMSMREYYRKSGGVRTMPKPEEIVIHLDRLMSRYKRTYIVIDAVDEVRSHRDRVTLFTYLKGLKAGPSIMLVARPNREFQRLLTPLNHECDICLSGEGPQLYHCPHHSDGGFDIGLSCYKKGNRKCPSEIHEPMEALDTCILLLVEPRQEDIRLYTRRRLENDDHFGQLLDGRDELKKDIVIKVVSTAASTFLSAVLHLDHLATLDTVRSVRKSLNEPFNGLSGTYQQALDDMEQQRSDRVHLGKEAIKWVMWARRPLLCSELEQAVQISYQDDDQDVDFDFDLDDIVPGRKLVEYCAGLLTVDYGDRVRFTHSTADDFLEPIVSKWFPDGQRQIASSCLRFLLLDAFDIEWPGEALAAKRTLLQRYEFHGYAARFWASHLRRFGEEAETALALQFLTSPTHLRTAYTLDPDFTHSEAPDVWSPLFGFHIAAMCKLPVMLRQLKVGGHCKDVNEQDVMGRTALLIATNVRCDTAVAALLDIGADPNIADHTGTTPLVSAINNEDEDIIELLLFNNTNPVSVNIPINDCEGLTPLMWATQRASEAGIRFLLRRADVELNAKFSGDTALSYCAMKGNIHCLDRLIADTRCDVQELNSAGYSPLHLAAMQGYTRIVKALVGAGAPIEQLSSEGKTALLHAVSSWNYLGGNYEVVLQLISDNASMTTTDISGCNVLHCAAQTRNINVLQLLLSQEAIGLLVDAQDVLGETPLHKAIQSKFVENAANLFSFGARTDIPNKNGVTAHQLAAQKGLDAILQGPTDDAEYVWMEAVPSRGKEETQHRAF